VSTTDVRFRLKQALHSKQHPKQAAPRCGVDLDELLGAMLRRHPVRFAQDPSSSVDFYGPRLKAARHQAALPPQAQVARRCAGSICVRRECRPVRLDMIGCPKVSKYYCATLSACYEPEFRRSSPILLSRPCSPHGQRGYADADHACDELSHGT